eukprot:scaffold74137_cov49-Cyclotella_meneghiniana.AAC.2
MTANCSLIVDFPGSDQALAIKSVRFSRLSTLKYMPYRNQDEKSLAWYSKAEEAAFRRQRSNDVVHCSGMLMQNGVHEDNLIQCVGIDQFLSEDIVHKCREIQQARLDHKTLVLNAQDLQRRCGIHKPEDLARISMHSSRVTKERAYQVARVLGSLS